MVKKIKLLTEKQLSNISGGYIVVVSHNEPSNSLEFYKKRNIEFLVFDSKTFLVLGCFNKYQRNLALDFANKHRASIEEISLQNAAEIRKIFGWQPIEECHKVKNHLEILKRGMK